MTSSGVTSILNFNGPVYADHATMGVSGLVASERGATGQGRLSRDEIAAALSAYISPPQLREAAARLAHEHVITLEGPAGIGKRAGAIRLLSTTTDGDLFALSPVISTSELATRRFTPGHGYVIVNRVAARDGQGSDVAWRELRQRLAAARAYLVVTLVPEETSQAAREAIFHVPWGRPDLSRAVRAKLGPAAADDLVDRVLQAVPDDCSMTDLTRVAQRLAAGETFEAALRDVRRAESAAVSAWLGNASMPDMLAMVVIAFLHGADRRTFETALAELRRLTRDSSDEPSPTVHALSTGHALATLERVGGGPVSGRMIFQRPRYRGLVLRHLWDRLSVSDWNAIRDWLDRAIDSDPTHGDRDRNEIVRQVAAGLVLLMKVEGREVEVSYLDPWSAADDRPVAQYAAAHTLGLMSYDDALAPYALEIVGHWTRAENRRRQQTAAVALAGPLGIRYPADAAAGLWALTTRTPGIGEEGCEAIAMHFANLIAHDASTAFVLKLLIDTLGRYNRPGDQQRLTDLTLHAVHRVLTVTTAGGGEPAVVTLLRRRPDRLERVADLWSGLVANSRFRRRGMEALDAALAALRYPGADTAPVRVDLLESVYATRSSSGRTAHDPSSSPATRILESPDE
ncbi:hypothetical protein [Dactylosporangium sp. CS-033363]|uniref:hypothetical protein n=1 Tax=Dactylosporangium sp. CS-033363 TaxID=3239935 RepID=UPI003D8CAAB4